MPFVGKDVKPPPVKSAPAAKKTSEPALLAKRTQAAESGMAILAMTATATGLHADAATIGMHAEAIAPEVAKMADDNAQIAKGLDWLMENGPWAALFSVATPMFLQLAVNHGLVKAERFAGAGVVSPGVLEARYKLAMTAKATEMLKEQKALEERLIIAQMELSAEMQDAVQRNTPADDSAGEENRP